MNSASHRFWTLLIGTLFAASSLPAPALAQFGGARIRPPRPGMSMPAVRPPVIQEKLEVEGGIVVAFLNLDRSPVGTLVEAKLRGKKIVNWWRRGATARLLDDLELSTAIDVPAPEDAGAPLKLPDALILCRTRIQEKDRICEIIVCETSLGLRLGAVRLSLTKEVGADVGKLADGAVKALGKLGQEMTELWGVPPLRSKDLGSKYDALRTQLAGLVEEELLRRKGAQLVELEYAHAIALARKHAGTVEPLQRATPIYLTGQFRNSGEGEMRKLAITLEVAGSEAGTAESVPAADLLPAEAEKVLRERVQAIAKEVGGSQEFSLKETATEIGTLASLSKEFQKSGDAEGQLAILETRLLLKDDFASMQETLRLLGKRVRFHWEKGQDVVAFRQVTEKLPGGGTIVKSVPNEQAAAQMQEGLTAMNLYRRGLQRIRGYLSVPPVPSAPQTQLIPVELMLAFQGVPPRAETPRSYIAAAQRLSREQREVAMQLVRREAKAGFANALLVWDESTAQERMQLVLRLIVELQDEPQGENRAMTYVLNGVGLHFLKSPEGEQFLAQLAELPNPAVQAATTKIKEQVAKYELPKATAPLPPPTEAEEKDADVRFVPLNLAWKDIPAAQPELKAFCELVVPAGKGVDLFCGDGQVLLMKKKGETKLIFDAKGQGYSFKQTGGYGIMPATACYDGKYAWIPMMCYGKPSRLLVVDVEKEKVTELKEDSGLPSEIPDKTFSPVLAAAALGPGKAFLVGSFGKTWLGTAKFDGEKGTIKIIHEAQDAPARNLRDQWRNTSLTFGPAYLFALSDPAADKESPSKRMIIGRASEDVEAFTHPLLVDPDSGKVTVLETRLNPGTATVMGQHAGSLYWVQTSSSNQMFGAEFMKLGFPDFEPTSLGKHPLPGKGYQFAFGIEDNRLHFFRDQWLTAESPDQPLQVLKGNLPANERTSPRHLMRSNHYGWVVIVSNFNRGYAVEFRK
ncbi:MAG: hypothetical protein IAF94_23710 [Pirellulaceae bacterium]|nr:hypothetical protein [Pirellulaceae bacterium]